MTNFRPNQNEYNNMTPFKTWLKYQINTWGLNSFPFVESDFDDLTNYAMMMKLMKHFNVLIENQNMVEEDMTKLYNAFTELQTYLFDEFADYKSELNASFDEYKNQVDDEVEQFETSITNDFTNLQNYVDNFFDNNFPQMISDKLDEMAEDGTLENLLNDAAHLIKVYNTYSEMIADSSTFTNGLKLKTLGYYEINDGGDAEYFVTNIELNTTYHVQLSNNLYLNLIVKNNTINIRQLGARSQNGSTKYDIKNYIDSYTSLLTNSGIKYKLYIPSGVWHTSGNEITTPIGFNIIGDENFSFGADRIKGTILTSYNDNQDHILNLGNSSKNCMGWNIRNINFSSAEYVYNDTTKTYDYSSLKTITSAFNLLYAEYGISDNLFFNNIKGQAMSISSSWENYFKLLNFRKITNHGGSILNFKTKNTSLTSSANITACTFENIMFESMHGNLINSESNSSLSNCSFNKIFVEDGVYVVDGESYTSFTSDNIPQNLNHYSIFNIEDDGSLSGCHINSILLNNYSFRFFEYNNQYYSYDTIITLHNAPVFSSIFDNISVVGMRKDCYLINMPNNLTKTNFYAGHSIIKNITNDSEKNFILNLYGLNYLECDANLFGRIYTFQMPTKQFYENGGWIGCYKSFSPRQYPTGLGLLFYDSDCQNKLQLCVKTRTDTFDRPILTTITNENRKIYLRAKVPNGETCRLYLNNRDETQTTSNKDLLGTGAYKIYELEVPSGWSIGTRIVLEMANEQGYTKDLRMDVYKSC